MDTFKRSDVVVDVMAGIGPFAVPAAQKGCQVGYSACGQCLTTETAWLPKRGAKLLCPPASCEALLEEATTIVAELSAPALFSLACQPAVAFTACLYKAHSSEVALSKRL